MIVPDFWAEAHTAHRVGRKSIKVRRFGWSNSSLQDAQSMAESRAREALARLIAGDPIDRRERKAAYNGAQGVPIREEVLARHGEEVITRNAYGAHCLNTPRALFADVDFEPRTSGRLGWTVFAVLSLVCLSVGLLYDRWIWAVGLWGFAVILALPIASGLQRLATALRGGPSQVARRRILGFLAAHPQWNVRLYQTPGGLRLLATHQAFEAGAPEVQQFFAAVQADPVYVRMCLNQNCFRARLTAKPWRIGVTGHMRPRPGVWPVEPARLHLRNQWVAGYEAQALAYAACRFIESLGSGSVHMDLRSVIDLHDQQSRALQPGLALA